jgi:hypothetical protein
MCICRTTQVGSGSLFAVLRDAWTGDTSVDSSWTPTCPALGQCAVTALVVQDYLGGDLMRCEVEGTSHYWNLVDGVEIDLTRSQFNHFLPRHIAVRSRDYVLSSPDTMRRYETLRARVARILGST